MSDIKRIFVVDPGLSFVYGHNHAYNMALQSACREAGLPAVFLIDGGADRESLPGYCQPLLPLAWSFYQECRNTEGAGLEAVRASAASFARALHQTLDPCLQTFVSGGEAGSARVKKAESGSETAVNTRAESAAAGGSLLFSHSLSPLGLLGLLLWRAELPPRRRPALAVNLMLDIDGGEICAERLAACKALLDEDDRACSVFAGSRSAAELAGRLLGRACSMLPSPLPAHLPDLWQNRAPEPPQYSLLGVGRGGKNLHLLPAAIQRYHLKGGSGRFLVHIPAIDAAAHPVLLALHDMAESLPKLLDVDFSHLESAAYYQTLAGSSALLLPYDPAAYNSFRPSGPAIEAAVLGVPVISFGGGFIEEELAPLDNGSLFAPRQGAASLAEALLAFDKEAGERKQRAMAAAPAYAARHNAAQVLNFITESLPA